MPITKKDLKNRFNTISGIEQIGNKQLFTATIDGKYVLISYYTIVGIFDSVNWEWLITTEKYSVTTSKQLTQFLNKNTGRYTDISDYIKGL